MVAAAAAAERADITALDAPGLADAAVICGVGTAAGIVWSTLGGLAFAEG